jgi:hypothetical protein
MQAPSRISRAAALAQQITCLTIALIFSLLIHSQISSAAPLPQANQGGGFLGQWCAQGDPSKQASITGNMGVFFTLTNENGDTSPGNLQGGNVMSAPGWQFVTGTLTPDGSQINWSNGTFGRAATTAVVEAEAVGIARGLKARGTAAAIAPSVATSAVAATPTL